MSVPRSVHRAVSDLRRNLDYYEVTRATVKATTDNGPSEPVVGEIVKVEGEPQEWEGRLYIDGTWVLYWDLDPVLSDSTTVKIGHPGSRRYDVKSLEVTGCE